MADKASEYAVMDDKLRRKMRF